MNKEDLDQLELYEKLQAISEMELESGNSLLFSAIRSYRESERKLQEELAKQPKGEKVWPENL